MSKTQDAGASRLQRLVRRSERGWGGHFICANRCRFRRNTLLECGDVRIVVSTVGLMESREGFGFETIGCGRHFETMAFHAEHDGRYWDADVTRQVDFDSPWMIAEYDADDRANDMHEAVVAELSAKMVAEEWESRRKELGIEKSNAGQECDMAKGPCACGAWH